jgi:hypothetical protein
MSEANQEHVEPAVAEPTTHEAAQEAPQGNYQEYSYIQPEGDQAMSVEAAAAVVAAAAAAAQNSQTGEAVPGDIDMIVAEGGANQEVAPGGAKKCAVVECDESTNGNRTLCARHQKRKERGEELQLKENHIFGHRKKQYSTLKTRQKHRRFKELHDQLLRIAGDKSEVVNLLTEFQQSNFYSDLAAVPREGGDKRRLYEQIGENAIELYKTLPPRSPFRRSLLCHLGNGIKQSEFADVCEINPRTIRYARRAKEVDIFKTTKYKVNLGKDQFMGDLDDSQEAITTSTHPDNLGLDHNMLLVDNPAAVQAAAAAAHAAQVHQLAHQAHQQGGQDGGF